MNAIEEWRPVSGFKGYEVSDLGNVRTWLTNHKGFARTQAKVMRLRISNSTGHRAVCLKDRKPHLVHRMVAAAFIGPIPAGMVVAHRDGDASNNRVSNLMITTHAVNQSHRIIHGTDSRGSKNVLSILREEHVIEIRGSTDAMSKADQFAQRFGVQRGTILAVIRGDSWKHVLATGKAQP